MPSEVLLFQPGMRLYVIFLVVRGVLVYLFLSYVLPRGTGDQVDAGEGTVVILEYYFISSS
jgi:hypothetical protein